MRILFSTNIPSPYRVQFFNELGKLCDLTVCYERHTATDRDERWKGENVKNFKEIYLNLTPIGMDQSKGNALKHFIKSNYKEFDFLVLTGYVSPAVRKAIFYCKRKKIPYCIEYDGGFNKKDNFLKRIIKKMLLCGAKMHLTTCEEHIQYLQSLGISKEKIFKYPFTSLKEQDILTASLNPSEKQILREKLNMKEKKVVLSIGQFIPRKGFDILLEAIRDVSKDIGVYIVGGVPTEEYLNYQRKYSLNNVHFIDFMDKQALKQWYMAADCFVLPTREDIWGLVVNEAMACGLPIVTTNKCVAGLELVQQGENGYIVSVNDSKELADKLLAVLDNVNISNEMGQKSLKIIQDYTIEKMARRNFEIFENVIK